MTRRWFSTPLETVATFWRILRRDGVTLGFCSHDRDLWFDGVLHRAAPGMVPSAIRRTAGLDADSAEISGVISHDCIAASDLEAGRFDDARVMVGLIDWESLESEVLYRGSMGPVSSEDGRFAAELVSRKAELQRDPVPRTSPTCRAEFCGPGCQLSPARFSHEAQLTSLNLEANCVTLAMETTPQNLIGGFVRWVDGPLAGLSARMVGLSPAGLMLDAPVEPGLVPGTRALVRQGCDRTIDTCATRFGNAINFQGEPFLPGNDLVTRYPTPSQ